MKIPFSKTAFWDTDINTLDETTHRDFIIARIFQYGLLKDLKYVLKHFSKEQISNAFKTQRGIDGKAINLARVLGYIAK